MKWEKSLEQDERRQDVIEEYLMHGQLEVEADLSYGSVGRPERTYRKFVYSP